MYFFDYGNAFLLEARNAGADVEAKNASKTGNVRSSITFRYPSYVQDIMG
jgi:urocanate hydratase